MNQLGKAPDFQDPQQQINYNGIPPEITIEIPNSSPIAKDNTIIPGTRVQDTSAVQVQVRPSSTEINSDIPRTIDVFISDPTVNAAGVNKGTNLISETERGLNRDSSRDIDALDTNNIINTNANFKATRGNSDNKSEQQSPIVASLPTTIKVDRNSNHLGDLHRDKEIERRRKAMSGLSPHSSLSDLFKASQIIEDQQAIRAAKSADNGSPKQRPPTLKPSGTRTVTPAKRIPDRPSSLSDRRRTTGDVSAQKKSEYYASLNKNTSSGTGPNNGGTNVSNWNSGHNTSMNMNANVSPSLAQSTLTTEVTGLSASSTFMNPFEDPSLIGDLRQSIPLTHTRSFPDEHHPLHNSRGPMDNNLNMGSNLMSTSTRQNSTPTSPSPAQVQAQASPLQPSASPSYPHSQFDPLLNAGQPRPLSAPNPIISISGTHTKLPTLDSAALADIAAALSTLKPQKAQVEESEKLASQKNHAITLGQKPSKSTGTKKSHRRFLSHQFNRKGGVDFEDGDDNGGHRRSNSAGASSSERPTTPLRKKLGLRLKKDKFSYINADRPGLEVIASASGEESEIKIRSSEQDPSNHQISIPSASCLLLPSKLCALFEKYRNIDQNFDFDSLVGLTREQMQAFMMQQTQDSTPLPSTPAKTATSPQAGSSSIITPSTYGTTEKVIMQPIMQPSPSRMTPMISQQHMHDPLSSLTIRPSQQQLMKTHVPIISSLLEADDDLVVEAFYHEKINQANTKSFDTASDKSTRDRMEVAIFKNDAQRQFLVVYQGCADDQVKPVKKGEHKDGVDRRFNLGRKDDKNPNLFSEDQPVVVFPHFRSAYHWDVEDKVFAKLDALAEEYPFFDVVMTGHSLGGVLAQLGGMRYANIRHAIRVSCFVYGCPKVGTTDFRYYVNSLPNLRVSTAFIVSHLCQLLTLVEVMVYTD